MEQHREIREGDEIYCVTCGKRWDVKETPPDCREKQISELNEVLTNGFKP